VLVEGVSDQVAVETLAHRYGRQLVAEGVSVVPMGGATNIRHFLTKYGPSGRDVVLAGLCDVGEERDFRRGLEWAGIGTQLDRAAMESLGFFVCNADLEDELIRSLGPEAVEHVIAAHGELASLRIMQKQPAQQGRTIQQQLRRFMGTRSGSKISYARLLVDALDLSNVPAPLDGLLAYV
jgi:OLD-like protein